MAGHTCKGLQIKIGKLLILQNHRFGNESNMDGTIHVKQKIDLFAQHVSRESIGTSFLHLFNPI